MKNNHLVLVLALVIILSLVAIGSSYITSNNKDKEQKKVLENYEKRLKKNEEQAQKKIADLFKEIVSIKKLRKQDSLEISGLKFKIKQDGVKMEKERKEASKMTTDEQKTWLVNRYNKSN